MSLPNTQTADGQSRGSDLLLKEAPTVTQPRLQDILGDTEARILQQIYYWISNPFTDYYLNCKVEIRTFEGRTWAKIPPAMFLNRWRGKCRFMGERTFKSKIASLKKQGVLRTMLFGGDTNWYCVLDDVVKTYDGIFQSFFDQVAKEKQASSNDENSFLRDIAPEREAEIWDEMQTELDKVKATFGLFKPTNALPADEQCKICTAPVQAKIEAKSSAKTANDECKISTSPVQKLPASSAEFAPSPYIERQQQESFKEHKTLQDEKTSDFASVGSALSSVVNVLNSSVVVVPPPENSTFDERTETPEIAAAPPVETPPVAEIESAKAYIAQIVGAEAATAPESDHRRAVKILSDVDADFGVELTIWDVNELILQYGAAAILEHAPQDGHIAEMWRRLENAPAETDAPAAPMPNAAPETATDGPALEFDDIILATKFTRLGFHGAAKFIARHGVIECAYQFSKLEGEKPDSSVKWLRAAIQGKYRYGNEPLPHFAAPEIARRKSA